MENVRHRQIKEVIPAIGTLGTIRLEPPQRLPEPIYDYSRDKENNEAPPARTSYNTEQKFDDANDLDAVLNRELKRRLSIVSWMEQDIQRLYKNQAWRVNSFCEDVLIGSFLESIIENIEDSMFFCNEWSSIIIQSLLSKDKHVDDNPSLLPTNIFSRKFHMNPCVFTNAYSMLEGKLLRYTEKLRSFKKKEK